MLVDTNVLLRALQPGHPQHALAVGAMKELRKRGEKLHVLPQNLVELWAVATRPASANGLGMSTVVAGAELYRIRRLFILLPETPPFYATWERLVITRGVSGKAAHDARLVAGMLVHNLSSILTFNTGDFGRYGISVVDPVSV
ncbi:MAG: PIN domain-containing protein [Acidobacteria bacterium]|nr:PIN domain-containing protein [Acidobacteriota bacterium]